MSDKKTTFELPATRKSTALAQVSRQLTLTDKLLQRNRSYQLIARWKISGLQAGARLSNDSQMLLTTGVVGGSTLWSQQGEKLTEFEGSYARFIRRDSQVVMNAASGVDTWIYALDASSRLEIPGVVYSEITLDDSIIVCRFDKWTSRIYDQSGSLTAEVPGVDPRLSSTQKYILTSTRSQGRDETFVWLTPTGRTASELVIKVPGRYGYFSDDDTMFVTHSRDETFIWDLNGRRILTVPGVKSGLSPNGRFIWSEDTELNYYKLQEIGGEQKEFFEAEPRISPDSSTALVRESGQLKLWDLRGWTEVTALPEFDDLSMVKPSFTKDGRFCVYPFRVHRSGSSAPSTFGLVVAKLDGTEVGKLQEVPDFSSYSVSLAPDASVIATCSTNAVDTMAAIWGSTEVR